MTRAELVQRIGELRAELSRLSELLDEAAQGKSSEEQRLRLELAELDAERASLLARAREAFAERDALESQVLPLREATAAKATR